MRIHPVGPIHRQVQMGLVIQRGEGNCQLGGEFGGPYGGWDTPSGACRRAPYARVYLQKIVHGGTGPRPSLPSHPVHFLGSALAGALLHAVQHLPS